MLQPARTKYRKQQKGRNTGIATRGNKVSFGEYGLKATTRGRLTARQLEAARRTLSRHIKRVILFVAITADRAFIETAVTGIEHDRSDAAELLDHVRTQLRFEGFGEIDA